ncbi:MAG: N-acetyltransferase family protein [Tepidisphaeraceae bacterium]|jgi:phosphinothricin acetyltransferase
MPSHHDPSSNVIRPAQTEDCEAINAIYNYYVIHSTTTYQIEPDTLGTRERWLAAHGPRHPVIVAECNGAVVGWGCLNQWRSREAYDNTVENSVYVANGLHGQGIGSAILSELMRLARGIGHHTIVAVIDAEQAASIRLHAKHGFSEVGRLKQLGFKFNRWLDVVYMQLML